MNKQTQTQAQAQARQKPLNVSEYLRQQNNYQRLAAAESQLALIKARQNRQAGWIILLLICMMVLMVAALFVLTVWA